MILAWFQRIAGIIILVAVLALTWWLLFVQQYWIEVPIHGEEGIIGFGMLSPDHATLAGAARYSSVLLLIFSLTVFILTILKKSAVTRVILGLLMAGLAVFIGTWGFPTSFSSGGPVDGGQIVRTFINPGPTEVFVHGVVFFTCLISLALAGLGIIQLVTSRKKEAAR